MFCLKCGKTNLDNAMYCAGCGADLTGKRPANKTWLSTTAGVLDIVAGSLVPVGFVFPVAAMLLVVHEGGEVEWGSGWFVLPAVMVISGIVAIVAGILLLRRKRRPTAFAGAIGATLTLNPVGLAALVFTVIARREFE
ncbi:MAG: zinc ribbon domain-containing protein [Dehalococcoidia bacterium]|nr:zinc ribbon domain-containing protein [Dehalococcoidia bacterium]